MFYVRRQFNRMVLENAFYSESQALAFAHKTWNRGGWHHIQVTSSERNEIIVELGTLPNTSEELVYAQAI
jgi:hypothetical protein